MKRAGDDLRGVPGAVPFRESKFVTDLPFFVKGAPEGSQDIRADGTRSGEGHPPVFWIVVGDATRYERVRRAAAFFPPIRDLCMRSGWSGLVQALPPSDTPTAAAYGRRRDKRVSAVTAWVVEPRDAGDPGTHSDVTDIR